MENLDFNQPIANIAKQIRQEGEDWKSALSRAATLKGGHKKQSAEDKKTISDVAIKRRLRR